jgi:small subunit ribosomal protein S3
MGHKKPPRANRLGVWVKREKDTEPRLAAEYGSNWFAEFNDFPKSLRNDWQIRQAIIKKLGRKAGISKVKVVRKDDKVEVNLHSIRPANVLGKDNQRIDELKSEIQAFTSGVVKMNVMEAYANDPQIIAEKIAYDMERRVAFRRAAKTAIAKTMSSPDIIGIKIIISGRLGGAEIARTEWYLEGKVPLHTWWANIENGFAEAETTYGIIGVKVITNRVINPGSNQSEGRGKRHSEGERANKSA